VNPLGFEDPRTEVGELLCPNRYDAKAIAEMKTALGPWAFASQAQQVPAPAGGGIFLKKWWKRWNFTSLPNTFDEVFMSWDMSFKKTEQGSYVVGQVWGKDGLNFYLLDQYRERASFIETCDAFQALCDKWSEAFAKYIEEKANGAAVISQFENTIDGIIPLLPKGSKEARAHAITPTVRAGHVFIPEDGLFDWVEEFLKEHTIFPNGTHDDQVDCTSQGLGEYIQDPLALMR
jgi:predicted phage terminase large subunit-like protein